jgi:2-amino-4-hydroxy-6-hydroxymethyldihydropteridine diphosphokinase
MTTAFVGVGSNIDPATNVPAGLRALRSRLGPLACSTVYETEAVGFDGPAFYNLVVRLDQPPALTVLTAELRAVEEALGRGAEAEQRRGSRTLDLDLLVFGDCVTDDPVPLPRSDVRRYAFVLKPLAELAPDFPEPASGVPFAELWAAFPAERTTAMQPVELDLPACAQ